MIYQVLANLFFVNEDEARDFLHDCEIALPKATVVNPHTENQECSTALLDKCFHDEDPHKPCEPIAHIDNCPPPPP